MLIPVLVTVLVVFVAWRLFSGEDEPVDRLPGPPKVPYFGCTFSFIGLNQEQLFQKLKSMMKLYGDRFLIKVLKRKVIHISNPEDVEIVLASSKNITKSYPYSFLTPWLGTGLLLSTDSKWYHRRKILTPTFHFNVLKSFSTVMEEKSRDLVTRLRQGDELEVNVTSVISDFTLYTICETAMGTRLDVDKSEASTDYKSAILSIGTVLLSRLTRLWLQYDFIFRHSKTGKNFYDALEKVQSFADNVILERKRARTENSDVNKLNQDDEEFGTKRRLAMMDLLLDAESKGEIDLEGIREEVNTFMFEGHDTTAMALSFCLMLLAEHDDVQNKIHDEQKSIFGDSDRKPAISDLVEMKYLEAVIKETLRLYPSVPFIARTITEDFMLGDLKVSKGHEVAVHIYHLHRRPDLYPDPDQFKPERFLEGGPKHPFAYVPFSAGPRNCIGQKFAMQEMKYALSELSRAFRLSAARSRPSLVTDMVLRTSEPIYVNFIKR